MRTLTIRVPQELQKADAAFENGGTVAEGALCGLPSAEALACEGHGPGSRYPLARSLAVADIVGEAPVQDHDGDVSRLMEIPVEMDMLLVKQIAAPGEFGRSPDQDGDQKIYEEAHGALPEGGEQSSVQGVGSRGFMSVEAASSSGLVGLHSEHDITPSAGARVHV